MSDARLTLRGVTRAYRGGAGVYDVDLTVLPGEIHALVGLNGAGKSTLMKLMVCMLRAGAGTLELLGRDIRAVDDPQWARVGALIEYPLAYGELDGRTNLRLVARLHGVARPAIPGVVERVIDELDLERYAAVRARRMSLGNKQRLGLAAALQHDPDLIVLDEPTNALDPAGVILLREALLRRAAAGAGVLVSSHHLDEVARIATRISVIAEGRMVGTLDPDGVDIERSFFALVHGAMGGDPASGLADARVLGSGGAVGGAVGGLADAKVPGSGGAMRGAAESGLEEARVLRSGAAVGAGAGRASGDAVGGLVAAAATGRTTAQRPAPPAVRRPGLGDAVAAEFRKARSSRVLWSTGVLLAVGVTVLAIAMVAAARSGDREIMAKLGPQAASGDWSAFLAVAAQVNSAAGLLACGVGISWIFGREFADGTIPGLFGLPVSRGAIAGAKLVAYAVWAVVVALALVVLLLAAGLAVGLGGPDPAALAGLARQFALGVLTALIAVPAGWAASLGRGLLPGIAVAVGILVIAQVSVVVGVASWVPFVAPALWAIHPDGHSALALAVVPIVPVLFGAATVVVWRRLELDR